MHDFLDKIEDLFKYSFRLGIQNSYTIITLNDEESTSAADFLRLLEYGSPLHNIAATKPLERTWLIMRMQILKTYDDCIDLLLRKNATKAEIDERMMLLATIMQANLKMLVDARIRNDVTCKLYYKGAKIN